MYSIIIVGCLFITQAQGLTADTSVAKMVKLPVDSVATKNIFVHALDKTEQSEDRAEE